MDTTVGNVMTRCPISVRGGTSFATVAGVLARNGIGALPVVDGHGRLVGVVGEEHLLGDRRGGTARELMDPHPHTVNADAPVPAAARLLAETGVRRLYVTEHGRLVGVVSRRDLLSGYLRDDDAI